MKKLLLVLAIGAFVACNDGGSADETKTDTTPVVDSTPPPPPADTTHVGDTTITHKTDTVIKK